MPGIEDLTGTQKAAATHKLGAKFSTPQRAMGIVLRKKVLDERYKWSVPDTTLPLGGKSLRITKDAWFAKARDRSLPWNSIVSTRALAPFYSPKAENMGQQVTDLVLIEAAGRAGDLDLLRNSWVGQVALTQHKLLLRVGTGIVVRLGQGW